MQIKQFTTTTTTTTTTTATVAAAAAAVVTTTGMIEDLTKIVNKLISRFLKFTYTLLANILQI